MVIAALALAGSAHAADIRVVSFQPVEDVALPFWCDWGYDWDERCYRDDGPRLAVGGELDKVWRSSLRFSLGPLPAGASVVAAELSLWYDGICLAPQRTSTRCSGRGFEFGVHGVLTPRWFAEREVEIGPQLATAAIAPLAPPGWIVCDVTDLVADWVSGASPNNGLLVKLMDGDEDYGSSGPLFPSASFADASVRPTLTIWYLPA